MFGRRYTQAMFTPPPADCTLCPRLVAFREANKLAFPMFYNGAVPPFGSLDAQILVVGLAPGLKGANASGRPFTGDFAGVVLYEALTKHGFASGKYDPPQLMNKRDDGFTLHNVRITNAVRCVPPENKPTPVEEKTCTPFLISEIAAMPNLRLILSLGLTSHQAVLRTFKLKVKDYKFAHGAVHFLNSPLEGESKSSLKDFGGGTLHEETPPRMCEKERRTSRSPSRGELQTTPLILLDSYHTSRYNVSTGRLTQAMFDAIIAQARQLLAR